MVVFASAASGCSWKQSLPLGIEDYRIEARRRSKEKRAIGKAEGTFVEWGCPYSAAAVVAAVDYSDVAGRSHNSGIED
jgi:hypothetical protein